MWRRIYFLLFFVRLWFAMSPSYLHPDENFQGPEVIAGEVFSYPVHRTWEFTSEHPIRSVYPLWTVYGMPMILLRWLLGNEIPPSTVFWVLRGLMFIMNFVLEDWVIYELVPSKRHRETAVVLLASSYVTWTYQAHTFSNSVETLVVAWSLVLIKRIVARPNRDSPLSVIPLALSGLLTTIIAVAFDTAFYTPHQITWLDLILYPVITPLNNLMYNISPENLAQHGLHPWYQHLLANLPMLVGPAVLLRPEPSFRLFSAVSGIIVLSCFPHQEARFLLPTIPLFLSSVRLPSKPRLFYSWVAAWTAFNVVFGILMGVYHQGGVIPTQIFMSQQPDATQAIWWKTYSPPIWLLNGKNAVLTTHDVMGMPGEDLMEQLAELATCDRPADRRNKEYLKEKNGTYLIAPVSATWLDPYLRNKGLEGLRFRQVWSYRQHLNLDDLDWGEDGVWNTLKRVIGRRGLAAWRFGMYVLFPIGIMYYFGTNLDERFAVPDFWPKAENANSVPTERDEIHAELQRLRARRLYLRDRRLASETQGQPTGVQDQTVGEVRR
ncbi:alpha -mannosyltransferase [Grosmannia clavigera kw1407]|uniref:Mannosyltransferase n=1 Tax=Grosmannia clavigera (strain kw1407 / UAMH 11150) TaxID=655863 RepID=F0XU96_GROCL|nr:alpha -mannosyltransferase [Grosmannia clavigera kw1407]EFW98991.1 alpha -mannosyltransferase [Grosmannia clavigera kw1407]